MSRVLMRKTEVWRVDTEEEAKALIAEMESNEEGEITKQTIENKQKRAKGIVIAENKKVTVQVDYAGQWDDEDGE